MKIAPGQEGMVEPVAQCLQEADNRADWRPVGIYDGELLVGFAMYGFFFPEYPPNGRVWLDRLLIDGTQQGKGYGREALAALLQRLQREYGERAEEIYLSVYENNPRAIHLYQQFGFAFNGERDLKGEHVMVWHSPAKTEGE